jgi:hypothetical protein
MTAPAALVTPPPPAGFPGFSDDGPLDLPGLSRAGVADLVRLAGTSEGAAFADAAARVGYCAHPVRVRGASTTIDKTTGEVVASYSSAGEVGGVTRIPCGNRREALCLACSRVYARDTFELIRAGLVGGKGVPEAVADNPLVFATLTAPSFGHVHGTRRGRSCRPRRRDDRTRCPHQRPTWCHATHTDDDELVGSPLCWECYDYLTHTAWQWWSPELWRRFTIALRRAVAARLVVPESRLRDHATISYARVAEPQRRGVMHFHALVRLDGPATTGGYAPAPDSLDADDLAELITTAAAAVTYPAPPLLPGDEHRVLRFGGQLDARPVGSARRVDDPTRPLDPAAFAGYLAKYVTKSLGDTPISTGHARRLRAVVDAVADQVVDDLGPDGLTDPEQVNAHPYGRLPQWTHTLGFRGHTTTKSRRYSVTMRTLRRARARWQTLAAASRTSGTPIDTADLEARLIADDDETTLVLGSWACEGVGWNNDAETALATATAARTREYAQWRTQQKHESY